MVDGYVKYSNKYLTISIWEIKNKDWQWDDEKNESLVDKNID